MIPSNEQRLARLEALFEMDETTATRLERRLDKIDDDVEGIRKNVNEIASEMKSAKMAGRILLGVAGLLGAVVGAAFHLITRVKV